LPIAAYLLSEAESPMWLTGRRPRTDRSHNCRRTHCRCSGSSSNTDELQRPRRRRQQQQTV